MRVLDGGRALLRTGQHLSGHQHAAMLHSFPSNVLGQPLLHELQAPSVYARVLLSSMRPVSGAEVEHCSCIASCCPGDVVSRPCILDRPERAKLNSF